MFPILRDTLTLLGPLERANLPPLWSSGQSSWLQIQRSRFDFRRYQIFLEVVVLERGPLSLLSPIEELFKGKVAAPD
jgi:ABC-type transporter Mla MlaB component